MITFVRETLRQQLPPEVFQFVRSCAWHSRFYWPRRAASVIVRHRSTVHTASGARSVALVSRLQRINAFAPTGLCRVMTRYGSDKGNGWHTYTTVYAALFAGRRSEPLRVFEVGLGTDNPLRVSSMGVHGRPGASLRGWREWFPASQVFGADIDTDILFSEERIDTFYCDQRDAVAVEQLWRQPALAGGVDIVIDDGLHQFEANVTFLHASIGRVRPCGYYIVEDILHESLGSWREEIEQLAARYSDFGFALVELPHATNGNDDNNLMIASRG
jgi:hypothetical protein